MRHKLKLRSVKPLTHCASNAGKHAVLCILAHLIKQKNATEVALDVMVVQIIEFWLLNARTLGTWQFSVAVIAE